MKVLQKVEQFQRYISRDIWIKIGHVGDNRIWFMQILYLSFLRFHRVRCIVRASSLTTVTMISIVPVMAFFFSVAKGFGAYQHLQRELVKPSLDQWFETSQAPELRAAIDQMLSFVNETDLSRLGVLGLITICYAIIRLLGSVELTFNDLWRIEYSRNMIRKISDYLTVSIVVPIILFLTASLSAAAKNNTIVDMFLSWGFNSEIFLAISFPILWFTFGFSYYFLPNRQVRVSAAFFGGMVGGTLWLIFHHIHVGMQVGVANYNALYASFSAFPIFMLWIFFSWIAVLVGASFAAAIQTREEHREYIIRENLSIRDREWIAIRICYALTEAFINNKVLKTLEDISEEVKEQEITIRTVLFDLKKHKLVEELKTGGSVLVRDPKNIYLYDVLEAVKGTEIPLIQDDAHQDLAQTQKEILEKLSIQHGIATQNTNTTLEQTAILHLQEIGLIEVDENKLLRTRALRMFEILQEYEREMSKNPKNISLFALYHQDQQEINEQI